jgi:hypothetical protein
VAVANVQPVHTKLKPSIGQLPPLQHFEDWKAVLTAIIPLGGTLPDCAMHMGQVITQIAKLAKVGHALFTVKAHTNNVLVAHLAYQVVASSAHDGS